MSWIKMRTALLRDPAVMGMARALNVSRYTVIGHLWAIWSWADDNTETGAMPGLTAADIDDIVDLPGFAVAMSQTKPSAWLVINDAGVNFPRYDRHNGKSAKRRAMQAERMAQSRSEDGLRTECAQNAHTSVTRGEERREEESREEQPPLTPPAEGKRARKEYEPKHPQAKRLVEHFALRFKERHPEAEPEGKPLTNLKAADRLAQAHTADLVGRVIDFYAGRYKPDEDFDWNEYLHSMNYLSSKWGKLYGEFCKQTGYANGHAHPGVTA